MDNPLWATPFGPTWGYLCLVLQGVFQRPLTLILLQKYRDTNGSRIVIQIGGVETLFCQVEGILLQKYRYTNGRCIAIFLKSIRVRGRFDFPDKFGVSYKEQQEDQWDPHKARAKEG